MSAPPNVTPNDVLIIGGGPAGAAAATWLARSGRTVTLVEREHIPHHKVCGEFLSIETCASLQSLNIDLDSLGAAHINRIRLAHGRRPPTEAQLPFHARSLSRRALDAALLHQAEQSGARVLRGHNVEQLLRDARWTAILSNGEQLRAATVFVATGKHDLRGHPRPAGTHGDLIAFKMHWQLQPAQHAALQNCVELFLFSGGYGGLEPIEDGLANLCVVIKRTQHTRWETLFRAMQQECPLLAERLAGAQPAWPRPLALSHIPYGFRRRKTDGIWWLGDQAAVIPSFTGDGMAIALHSGRLAADTLLRGGTATDYQQRLSAQVSRQMAQATAVSRLLVAAPAAAASLARLWPGGMAALASATRIPKSNDLAAH